MSQQSPDPEVSTTADIALALNNVSITSTDQNSAVPRSNSPPRSDVLSGSPVLTAEPALSISESTRLASSSVSTSGRLLTGKQEHYLKRELISEQVKKEIHELNSPTALRRFGAPFRSDLGEISPLDSELPILRYIFVHHIRDFPFLDKAREKEFWQDKLQVFLESFASKSISSSEDRLEETKRRKLATKCQKLIELMIVSGVRTASGFEERIRFSEIEIVDSNAIDTGVMNTIPEGNFFNGWDVNVAGVRMAESKKRHIRRSKQHAEFILRVKRQGSDKEYYIARRYGEFVALHKNISQELPGKVLPNVPKKNKTSTVAPSLFGNLVGSTDSASISSVSTRASNLQPTVSNASASASALKVPETMTTPTKKSKHGRSESNTSWWSRGTSPRSSHDILRSPLASSFSVASKREDPLVVLGRENQRISLRAFLRSLLQNATVANTKSIEVFLTKEPITLDAEDQEDLAMRKSVDERRVEEQKRFYEIARKRAADLDEYMEQFRQDIVEHNGLTKLFTEIKEKERIDDLSIQYRKFAEWLRIEVAATIYHLFLAEDNSPELFAQAKRIHSLIPYTVLKNTLRFANPAAVMSSILKVFLARPLGARSLMQHIFSLTLQDGIRSFQSSIDTLASKIDDSILVDKIKAYTSASDDIKNRIREEGNDVDIIVAILRSEEIGQALTGEQMVRLANAERSFDCAIATTGDETEAKQNAQLFSYLKQLLKLCTRQRDKAMMLNLIEEPVTLQLFSDLFTIFYEPLVRVYKAANVYNSVTDFALFVDDMIKVVEQCQEQDVSADPNQTVQAFIDLCARHEHNFYKFVHEVHIHDNGLFTQLMGWIEGILEFLRKGPTNGALDINALFEESLSKNGVDGKVALDEINQLIAWQEARKKWHQDKTRQKMAAETAPEGNFISGLAANFSPEDFGIDGGDLVEVNDDCYYESETEDEDMDEVEEIDPIEAERRRRAKRQDRLRRTAGEPKKPTVQEVHKLKSNFLVMLRGVLAK